MQNKKSEKGITLVVLVITVMVLSAISIPIVIKTSNITRLNQYTKFKDDIDALRESISIAYFDKDISTIGPKYTSSLTFLNGEQNGQTIKNQNDNDNYYAIDVNKVNANLSVDMNELNKGSGNKSIVDGSSTYSGTDDVYIINEASKTIYYVRGVEYKGKQYYRLYEEFSKTNEGIKPGEIVADFNKTFTDIYGATAKVPVGYKVSTNATEQIVSKGLVISDNSGNEFVWIPVQSYKDEKGSALENTFNRYRFGSQVDKGKDNASNSTKFSNSSSDANYFYEGINKYEALSVLENKGFYIGRYEAGSTTARTSSSAATTLNIKKGINIYNWVTKEDAQTISEKFISNDKVKSRLCSSYAWDTTLKFIEQTGNSSYLTTAKNTSSLAVAGVESINNIFDIAGNAYEWTTEISSTSGKTSTVRGGSFGVGGLATTRTAMASAKNNNIGFRITLFLSAD